MCDHADMSSRRSFVVLSVLALVLGVAACGGDDDGDGATTTTIELSAAAREGQQVAEAQGCTSCHQVSGDDGIGPAWQGLAGSEVQLADGSVVVADEAYLTRAIVEPNAQIVEGYNGIMPERALDDDEVAAIVAYLQEIGAQQ
jgi:cytochrome c oxidase subunit 2